MRTTRIAVAMLSFSFTLLAADPFVGTWKLNVAKSTLKGSNADIASASMTISPLGPNAFRTTQDELLKSGEKRHVEINRTYDGKEHPATGVGFKKEGASEIDQRVNESTRKITIMRDGKVTGGFTSTVSPDGKMMTNAGDSVLVFDRQ
jgi:hypothetical protein